jgi:hypothetical protein
MAALAGVVLILASAAYATTLTITTTSLPNSVDGVAVSYQLTSSGGTGTVTWKLASGSSLVTGLSLSTGGLVSGTPTASTNGPGSFKVTATDTDTPADTATATIAYIVNPENGNFRIISESFPNSTVGTAYSAGIKSSGGVGNVTYTLIKGTVLPQGLTLSADGAITGTPMAASPVTNFWVQATDSSTPTPKTVTAYLGIVVAPSAISVTTGTVNGTVGVFLSTQLTATGGKPPYTWAINVTFTPFNGLTLSSTGLLTGTPQSPSPGEPWAKMPVKVSDSSKPPLENFVNVALNVPLTPQGILNPSTLPAGTVGQQYDVLFQGSGGYEPYTWTIASANPPAWMTLTPQGSLGGFPTQAGNVSFTVQMQDGQAKNVSKTFTIPVAQPITASNQTLVHGVVGSKYSAQLTASGGTPPYKWSVLSAPPPPGLTLSAAGVLSGTPKQESDGPFDFGVRVTDSAVPARTGTTSVSITIVNPVIVGPATLAPAYLGALYQGFVGATGGTPPYTFTQSGLPSGLSFSTAGEINGTPKSTDKTGTSSITVTAMDSSTPPITGVAKVSLPMYAAPAQCTPKNSSATTLAWFTGGYAFHLEQVYLSDGNADAFTLGAFTADGKGNITGGIFDTNGPLFPKVQSGTFTGTYAIGTDGRGIANISIPQSGGGPAIERSFCLAIDTISGGVAGAAQMLEADATDVVAHGRMFAQGGSDFTESSVKGSYAFGMQGGKLVEEGYVLRRAVAGYMTLDGAGKVSTGEIDSSNDDVDGSTGTIENSYNAQVSISGTYTLASTGRGTLTLTSAGGGAGLIFYVTGGNQILVMSSEPGVGSPGVTNDVEVGRGFLRTATTFSNATLSGTSVFIENGVAIDGTSFGPKTGAGILTWDGKGDATALSDENDAGTVKLDKSSSGSYTVDSNGRAVLSSSGSSTEVAVYLVGLNAGFGVSNDTSVTSVEMDNQMVPSGGFTGSSIAGPFSEGSKWYSFVGQTAFGGEFTVDDTAETFASALDRNKDGAITIDQTAALTYDPAADGRFQVDIKGTANYILYWVSDKEGYAVDITTNPWPVLTEIHSQ